MSKSYSNCVVLLIVLAKPGTILLVVVREITGMKKV